GGLDERASANLVAYLAEQREATGSVPSDRTLVVERFHDELGDWRVVLHSPFGMQVHSPWGLAVAARVQERFGVDGNVITSDDGIVVRLPDTDGEPPGAELFVFDPDEIDDIVTAEVSSSALFASRFRECAARALLLPRYNPSRRSPLWQQRQRASQLLAVAGRYEQFPVTLEAMRECVQDVYDLPGLRELMSDVQSRTVRVVEVATPSPSPFARSLLFGYVGMFLYESDAPLAERRAAALSLDSTLLAELLGSEAIRELLDPEVLAEVEAQLQRLAPDRHARDAEGAADLLRFLGDLSTAEAGARGVQEGWLRGLEAARRAIRVRIGGEERWLAIEDAGRVRDALGAALPVGVPETFTEPVTDPLGDLVLRYARSHGPFTAAECAARFGLGVSVVTGVLDRLVGAGRLVRGELRPLVLRSGGRGTDPVEYCDAEVLRRLRRASLARLRAEVEPVEQQALGRFLPAWQGVQTVQSTPGGSRRGRMRRAPGAEDVLGVVEQLAGAPLPASALEALILPARLPGYTPALLDELTAAGEVTWSGCGPLAGSDGWLAVAPSDVADLLLPEPEPDTAATPLHRAVLAALGLPDLDVPPVGGGALFFRELADRAARTLLDAGEQAPADDAVVAALWDLVWAGLLTNDTLAPLRARLGGGRSPGGRGGPAHRPRRSPARGRYAQLRAGRPAMPSRTGPPSVGGRWSLAVAREPDPTRRAHARAEAFLERHGVLTRGALGTERVSGGFAGVYRVLRAMEDSGRARRGYVVEGLGAAQFAVPGAIDRLRALSRPDGGPPAASDGGWPGTDAPAAGRGPSGPSSVVLAAADPAQPYGAALAWPATIGDSKHRPGRKAGALVVLVEGAPVLYVERGGRSLLSFDTERQQLVAAAHALAGAVHEGWLGSLAVERADGVGSLGTDLADVLTEAGFRVTPKGLRLRA
ncbi:MAG TPA: DEAD/DEAH box helicase, partial [Pseudonocardia sp.]|nr:DEAD/DEAH box helicase [Pseudonocardia sp.]